MSGKGKILLILSVVSLISGAFYYWVSEEPDYLWIPFGTSAVFFIIEAILDFKFYKEFLTLRTTKHGMNMGMTILLFITLLIFLNFIAFKNNIKWDLSPNKVHSLSEQSIKVIEGLKNDLEMIAFFTKDSPQEEQIVSQFREVADLYTDYSNAIKVQVINPIKRPELAKKYNIEESGSIIFKYNENQTTITELGEQAFTNAIVKVTRDRKKSVYFLSGHGEPSIDESGPNGLEIFKKDLVDYSYEVSSLNLINDKVMPNNLDVLVIAGPKFSIFDNELELIKEFLEKGGNLFVAADPGKKHNLKPFLKEYGVDYKNSYILDGKGQMVRLGIATALGETYSSEHEITKSFSNPNLGMISAYHLASPVVQSENPPKNFLFDSLVFSSNASFERKSISDRIKLDPSVDKFEKLPLAISVKGFVDKVDENKKISENGEGKEGSINEVISKEENTEFNIVVFGDSDFLTNKFYGLQLNRNLALNVISFLASDDDLISIRPKDRLSTQLTMTNTQAKIIFIGLAILALIPFILSFVIWWRRRGA